MDRLRWFDRLETTAESPDELFEHFESRSADGLTYHVLPDARHGLERGTVLVESAEAVVRGFPSIPRVLVLDSGVPEFFEDDRLLIEEKLNGFNVRIADVDEVYAFTRSGYCCPFSTARARSMLDAETFFDDHPRAMLCAELIGPETPYTSHEYEGVDSCAFRVFDVRDRESGEPVRPAERRDLCEHYGFEQPRSWGWHAPAEGPSAVQDAITELDDRGREGVVMKSADGTELLKYTTETHHHGELSFAFSLPFEYGRDFIVSRVIREAFQAVELDESAQRRRERAQDLGESILLPAAEAIESVDAGQTVGERHTVRGDPETIDALLDHLRSFSLTLEIEADRREDGQRVVTFCKVASSTIDRIDHYLDGGTLDE